MAMSSEEYLSFARTNMPKLIEDVKEDYHVLASIMERFQSFGRLPKKDRKRGLQILLTQKETLAICASILVSTGLVLMQRAANDEF